MTRDEFNNKLDYAGISKKKFCEIIGLNYDTVNGWGSNNKKIPIWVDSWLNNCNKAMKFDYITGELCRKLDEIKDEDK